MLIEVAEWLAETFIKIWNMLLRGGYMGLAVILFPILRKIVSIMKQFTN